MPFLFYNIIFFIVLYVKVWKMYERCEVQHVGVVDDQVPSVWHSEVTPPFNEYPTSHEYVATVLVPSVDRETFPLFGPLSAGHPTGI